MPPRSLAHPRPSSIRDIEASGIEDIDTLFSLGGLTRSRHGKPLRLRREARRQPSTAEELMRPAAEPVVAVNGVHWLPVSGSLQQQRRPVAGNAGWNRFWAGFSTRIGGVSRSYCPEDAPGELNLGFTTAGDRDAVLRNRHLLVEAITGSSEIPLVTARQFHSNLVVRVAAADAEHPRRADGLMTDRPGLLLAVTVADCIPVLVADRKRRVAAAFHAGWRGTVKRIVETGIGRMRLEFGSRPEDLVAAIGPGAGPCCYAVGEVVISEFESQFIYARQLFHEVYSSDSVRNKYPMLFLAQRAPGHSDIGPQIHLDLVEANRRQLLDAGLRERAIQIVGGCTNCHPELFYSHRASRGHAGRMMAVIGLRG